jgi:hypothetical protein
LRSVLERMASQFKLEVDTSPPRIPYRETIMGKAEGFHRHKKQTGGAGQFGEVSLRIEPRERGAGFEFVDQTKGGVIPHQFMPAVQKGVEQVLVTGAIAGFPLQDVRVIVHDGKHHACRFEGSGVRRRRQESVPRRDREGEADRARARSSPSRSSVPNRTRATSRRPVVPARSGHRHSRPATGRARDHRAWRRLPSSKAIRRDSSRSPAATARGRCSYPTTSRRLPTCSSSWSPISRSRASTKKNKARESAKPSARVSAAPDRCVPT